MRPVVSLCDRSGNMVRPWAEAGWPCECVDILNEPRVEGNITFVRADVFHYQPPLNPRIMFAAPPCTHLANSGAMWFASKGIPKLIEALQLVERCRELCEHSGAPWMIENPVGRLSTCWRRPDYVFHPYQYGGYLDPPGDAYAKSTCVWVGAGFVMPRTWSVTPVWTGRKITNSPKRMFDPDSPHRDLPVRDRGYIRAITPLGFAIAVCLANGGL